jgi:hypothetical protein
MDSQPNWYVYLIGTVLGGYFKIGISTIFEKYWGNHLRGEWFTDINVIDFTEDVRHVWETKAKHLGFTANHCQSLLEVAVVPITVESTS